MTMLLLLALFVIHRVGTLLLIALVGLGHHAYESARWHYAGRRFRD